MQDNNLSGNDENSEIIPSELQAFVRIAKKAQSLNGAIPLSAGKNQVWNIVSLISNLDI